MLIASQDALEEAVHRLARNADGALSTRIHGDFHLGQVLVVQGDAYIIDFEGEPARPMERAAREILAAARHGRACCARSTMRPQRRHPDAPRSPSRCRSGGCICSPASARMRRQRPSPAIGRCCTRPTGRWVPQAAEAALLDLFLIEKAAYEIRYEAVEPARLAADSRCAAWQGSPTGCGPGSVWMPEDLPDPGAVDAIVGARHGDPFALLGPHAAPGGVAIRAFLPRADTVEVVNRETGAAARQPRAHPSGRILRTGVAEAARALSPAHRRGRRRDRDARTRTRSRRCSASSTSICSAKAATTISRARMGAHVAEMEGVRGVRFAVWAPNAQRVSVVGDFNAWDGRCHPMRLRHGAGVWELFIPAPRRRRALQVRNARRRTAATAGEGRSGGVGGGAAAGHRLGRRLADAAPLAGRRLDGAARGGDRAGRADRRSTRCTPSPGSRAAIAGAHGWRRAGRAAGAVCRAARLHACRAAAGDGASVRRLLGLPAARPVRALGAARAARGVRRASSIAATQAGIGVILDWVPAHFPTDAHGLARFDGTPLYEHADPREGFHRDWNTMIYNLGRNEVRDFLIGSRAALARALPRRRAARGCRRLDAVPRLQPQAPASGCRTATAGARTGGDRRSCRSSARVDRRARARRGADRRGEHRVARRHPPGRRGRARLHLQMEHGLDARHARLHAGRSDQSPLASRRA